MPEILDFETETDFEPETQSRIDFQPEALDFSPDPPPKTETEAAFRETPPVPVSNPRNEEIKASPSFFEELKAGRIGSAYYLAKKFLGEMRPSPEPGNKNRSLLGTMEQLPQNFGPPGMDPFQAKIARAIINVGNRTMAGLTTQEMLPLAVVGSVPGAVGRVVAGAFGADMARHLPETLNNLIEANKKGPLSQEAIEADLDTVLQTLMIGAAGRHALRPSKPPVSPASEPGVETVTPERAVPETPQGAGPAAAPEAIPRSSETALPPENSPTVEAIAVPRTQGQLPSGASGVPIQPEVVRSQPEITPESPASARPSEPGTEAAIAEIQRRNAPAEPRLLPGEKQGDLITSTQAEDFALVGEKGVDFEARRAKSEAEAQATEEARLKAENEQGLLDEFRTHEGRGGDELLDAINAEGGLPAKSSPRSGEFAGELENVRQELKNPSRKERISYADIFKKDAPDIDTLATRLKAKGFNIETPGDILDLVRERIRSGRPLFGNEAMGAEPFGFGPGAASGKEVLASYELRRFGKRFQETEGIHPAIREATGDRYYEPISNKLTFEEAGKIIEERGTDNAIRLVRDENFAMEPRVRATLAQSLVTKLNQSHAEATAAGDVTRAKGFLDQAVDTAEYLGEFGTRLGQGVQSFAIWSKLTPEGMLESAKRSAKRANVELTPEQQAEIRRLAQEAHEAKEGIPKQDATKKLADYMVKQTGIPAGDLPLSIYYTHILSGVQTHLVNAVDTGLNTLHNINSEAVANPRAAAFIYSGLMRGLGEGRYDALLSLQEGRRIVEGKFIESPDLLEVSTFGKKGGVPIAVKGPVSKAARRIAESKIATPLNTYKYVMRMMSASDAVFFRGAEEARAGLLAHRLAEATGVERAKLKSEVDSILGYDRLPEFRAEAAREGYTGAKAEARATELMIQSRPESLRADASDYAGVSTYNHTPRGVLGYLSNQVAQVSNKYPALKLFVPFTRIVANVTNRGLDNTPMGIMRALREKGLSAEERQRVLTRGIMGTTGIIGLGVLNATGAISIHGAGPTDPEKKRQLQSAGWKPFSIQVGDKYYTYTYTPIGLGVSVLGNYLDSQRYKTLDEKDALTRATYAMSRIGQTVFSQSFLSGLSNLFTILSGDPGRSVNSLKQFFSNVATAATTPNLFRDINHLFDPTLRKSETIAQDLIRNIPIARLNLRPTLNAFGEPVILSRNRFFSGQSDDPAWRVVVDKNLRVPVVDQTTFEDSEDGYLYAKIAGERMRKYIVSNLTTLNRVEDQVAQDMLSKASRAMFDEARQDVVRHGGVKKKKRKP